MKINENLTDGDAHVTGSVERAKSLPTLPVVGYFFITSSKSLGSGLCR